MIGNMEAGGTIAVGTDDMPTISKPAGHHFGSRRCMYNLETGGAVTLGQTPKGGTVYTAAAFTWNGCYAHFD
jgi:hypothetical protein